MLKKKNTLLQPVLKWAGGKRQLLIEIQKYIPNKYNVYYEPFLGGGAVLFHMQPQRAVINDINEELINCYKVIKHNPKELLEDLRRHKNEKDYFLKIRELDRSNEYGMLTDIEKASRLIFLNKTCFNGLFRVNSRGEFNVPFGGYKNPKIADEIVINAMSNYFNNNEIEFRNNNFSEALKDCKKSDFIYLDPPYDPISDSSSFTGYALNGFNKNDQISLKEECDRLNRIGCKFLLSNSSTQFIRELYKEYKIEIVSAKRNINSIASKRGEVNEVLIRNYD